MYDSFGESPPGVHLEPVCCLTPLGPRRVCPIDVLTVDVNSGPSEDGRYLVSHAPHFYLLGPGDIVMMMLNVFSL